MAAIKLTTNVDPEKVHVIARRSAEEQGYRTEGAKGRWDFSARQGSMALTFFLQALATYCDFRITIDRTSAGTELIVERNSPWWTGKIGVNRVKARAEDLARKIA